MSQIIDIKGREILDSRGNPTVEAEVYLESGIAGRFAVPSGASTGEREAIELRDNEPARYSGKGVEKAVKNINEKIRGGLAGLESDDQRNIDNVLNDLDGTDNKSKLGANAILAVSVASARASANELGMPLYRYIGGITPYKMPIPMSNVINGGEHADNNLDIQEFMIMPVNAVSIKEAVRINAEVFHVLKKLLNEKNLATGVGDEGGFAPMLSGNEEALDLLMKAVEKAGLKPGEDIWFAIDAAASSFASKDGYLFEGSTVDSDYLIDKYSEWIDQYPLLSIEDGLSENDWDGWKNMNSAMGDRIQIVGDDIFVTNTQLLKRGIEEDAANSILIKLNQIGTLTETIEAVEYAREHNWTTVVSHRSGETADSTIADLAVGLNTGFIKTGSMSRGERTSKYNQLIRIEEMLSSSYYPQMEAFYNIK
ncbi:MAG: phosphopyruvate hydratase [bacterium]